MKVLWTANTKDETQVELANKLYDELNSKGIKDSDKVQIIKELKKGATLEEAIEIVENAEIFAIGYSLPSGNVYDDTNNNSVPSNEKYGNLTAEDILRDVANEDTTEDIEKNISHYINANPDAIASVFTNIASSISYTPAGTSATLTDNIGSKFKIVGQSGKTFTIISVKFSNEVSSFIFATK